jgi:alkylation response protein AidB-like acyl-CoA dehydrogenase
MSLVLTEDQVLLKQSAADFVKKESPVSRVRKLRDERDPDGFSRALWRKMAELGWQGILIPEQYGGLSMGFTDLACVLEECGRNLVPEPLLSTVALGVNAVLLGGIDEQKREILPRVAEGSLVMTVAYQEKASRYDLTKVACRADRRGDAYVLNGEKTLVLDGHIADLLVVAARTSGAPGDARGVSLFLVPRGTPGLETKRQEAVHLRNLSWVSLRDAEVPARALLGAEGAGLDVLEAVTDRATSALCAEMLGGMQAAFEMTLDYLKTRRQFGVLIGTFQALKHRAARMFVEIELARSAVLGACDALDRGAPDARALVSVAKARCSDAAMLVGYEGVQMHGGIGMTDEHDIGFYLKRARGNEITFGDAAFHRDRFARVGGF